MENIYREGWSDIVQITQPRDKNMTIRKLFYTESMEVDKPKPSDVLEEADEIKYREDEEEGDEPREIGRNDQD